jgi:RNA polymerase sigma-70 factor (ECF subfamily)
MHARQTESMFFFEKKNQKTFATCGNRRGQFGNSGATAREQKFFGSFFQKRTLPLTQTTDAALSALMAASQGGNRRAYQSLLRAAAPLAAATARRMGVPPDRVDDVVQDVLLTVHRARATYDPMRPFLPWLRAIAQRRAVDVLRTHIRTAAREVADDDAYLNHPGADADADAGLDRADQARLLAEAIALLPPGQRQAVEVLALRERSLEEASGLTGRSKVALKVNLHRAIQALRTRLVEGGDG